MASLQPEPRKDTEPESLTDCNLPSRASWRAGLVLALGGIPLLAGETTAPEPVQPPANVAEAEPLGNLLINVDQVFALADKQLLHKQVREIEGRFSGNFRYVFELGPERQDQVPGLWPNAPRRVELVVTAPEERKKLLEGLTVRGFTINSTVSTDISLDIPPSVTPREADPGYGNMMMNGLLIGLFGVMAYVAYRSYRLQQRMAGDGGTRPGSDTDPMTQGPGSVLNERPKQRFSDVGGCPEVIADLTELKQDIQARMKGNPAVELPRGFLFCGPPGVGKTLIARALAGECDVPFIHVDSSQSGTTVYVGTGAMKVTKTWETARQVRDQHTKQLQSLEGATGQEEGICIIFYDEFDSIGSKRTSTEFGGGGEQEHKKVVNTLLNQMDGLDAAKNRNIIVIAATNFATDLDPALLRPGRFSKKIEISEPRSMEQRLDILEKLSKKIVMGKGLTFSDPKSLEYVAKISPGKTGDQLRDILSQSVDIARREGRLEISNEDLFEAYQRQSFGRAKKNLLPPDKHELVIRHENGHALCALACGIELFLVSSVPRGNSGGRVVIDPEGIPEILATKKDMLKSILLSSGGRAAEIEAYGANGITSGAGMDLQQIRGMVTEMISQGLIEGIYAEQPVHVRPDLWKEEHKAIINDITSQAIRAGREIISTIGEERCTKLVDDLKTLDRELIGPEAHNFYLERLGPDNITKISEIAERFFANPTARGNSQP